jgi:TPR repeat protein
MKRTAPRLVGSFALALWLAPAGPVLAQAAPAPPKPLHVRSSAEVRNDPAVANCRQLAARRVDSTQDSVSTVVEKAMFELRTEVILDAVARCRVALALYPNEPDVIVAHYNASEALLTIMLGMKFPDSEEAAFAIALETARQQTAGFGLMLVAFYVASAYEYGIGTKPDLAEATKWYGVAANAGDPISKRELTRLQTSGPAK